MPEKQVGTERYLTATVLDFARRQPKETTILGGPTYLRSGRTNSTMVHSRQEIYYNNASKEITLEIPGLLRLMTTDYIQNSGENQR